LFRPNLRSEGAETHQTESSLMRSPATSLRNGTKRITDGVIIVDHQWHLKYANQAAAQVLKHPSPAEWTGHVFQEEFTGAERKEIVKAGSRAIRDGTPVAVLSFSARKNCALEYRLYPSCDDLVIVIAEIPQPPPARSNIDDSEHMALSLADRGFTILAKLDWEGRFTEANQRYITELGLYGHTLIGRSIYEVFPGYDATWTEILERSHAGFQTETAPQQYQHPDGSTQWIKWYAFPRHEPDGSRKGCLVIAEIVTERINNIIQLKKLAKDLTTLNAASQKLHKLLTPEQLSQEIIEVLESFLDYSYSAVLLIDEVDGETLVPFALSTQKQGKKFIQKDKRYIRSKGPRVGVGITGWVAQHGQSLRVGNVQEDPRYFSMRTDIHSELCVPLFLNDRVAGVVNVETTKENAYSEDDQLILETIAAQISVSIQNALFYERLQQAFIERENMQNLFVQSEKVAALGRLSASIAHEINNPLQSIKGFLSLFRQEVNARADKEKIERYSDIMEEEIDRIARLIRNMRDFYRREATDTEFADVNTLLDTVLTLTAKQFANYGIEVVTFLAKPLPLVAANADHIKQLFMNLVLNAIDAMNTGGSLLVATSIVKSDPNGQGSMVEIKFTDTGPGMSKDVLDHMFESFFTTKQHGSGLGLYISRDIVKSYGGTLSVFSVVDNGSTFTVHLPAYSKEV